MIQSQAEGGWTLVELVVTMTLFLVILTATLTSLNAFSNNENRNQNLADSQYQTRVALDSISKELRNLASPDNTHPDSVEFAKSYDFVFRTVNPVGPGSTNNETNLERVRYCLDRNTPDDATLYRQVEVPNTNTALRPFGTTVDGSGVTNDPLVHNGCPAPNLGSVTTATLQTTRVIGQHVTNVRNSQDRPVFKYLPSATPTTDITMVIAQIFLDVNKLAQVPAELNLTTSAYLRNQNRRPLADIETPITVTSGSPPHLLLNGTGSYDPDGGSLTYKWTVKTPNSAGTTVGTSTAPYFDFTAAANTKYSATLEVSDPSPLSSNPTSVCAATGTASCP